ncbi:MAG TPA: hypothetical protein VKT77_00670 [Chthonomonadaceae bacterium]|nr:hypothetical protein [Chthonomonadaceae bacterium]
MRLFGLNIGKEKPMPFEAFRDHVRLTVRRAVPGAVIEPRDYGFVLKQEGKPPTTCNLRGLYGEYSRNPGGRDSTVQRWIDSLTMEIPDHNWIEAQMTLRPCLKNAAYLDHAQRQMQKNSPPDSLPFAPFAGDLSVIVMRELPGTIVGVTQGTLDGWGVTFEQAMQQALNNMNMQPFPAVTNALTAGGGPGSKRDAIQEEVGLVFEGDHLTATWLVVARFRDFVSQRLQGDFVAYTPTRSRLTVVRADEPGLIAQVQTNNRNTVSSSHWLTHMGFHVSGVTTGGVVSVHKPGLDTEHRQLDERSQFAAAAPSTPAAAPAMPYRRPGPIDLSSWGGLAESTSDDFAPPARGR